MAGKATNSFYSTVLNALLTGGSVPTLKLRLYSNNYTPTLTDVVGDYTEVTAAGYSAITLSSGSWSVSVVSGQVVASYTGQIFTMTAAVTVYGYYVTDSSATEVLWAELASGGPFTYGSGGGSIYVQLNLYGPTS